MNIAEIIKAADEDFRQLYDAFSCREKYLENRVKYLEDKLSIAINVISEIAAYLAEQEQPK